MFKADPQRRGPRLNLCDSIVGRELCNHIELECMPSEENRDDQVGQLARRIGQC